MSQRSWIVIIVGGLLAAPAAHAVFADPMHCEAKVLNAESRYYRCLARCDRRFAANERFDVERCEERCRNAMEKSVARIEKKRRCRPPTADPNLCESRLLKIESQHLSCQSRCDRKNRLAADFDEALCSSTCDTVADVATAETMGEVLCSDGRVNGDSE
jgi:hypothetical protein